MKKIFLASVAVLAVLAGCKKNEVATTGNVSSFEATFEQPINDEEAGKTILGDHFSIEGTKMVNVNWLEGDKVAVIYQPEKGQLQKVVFTATPNAENPTKAFLATKESVGADWTPLYAFYPADEVLAFESTKVHFLMPSLQALTANSFANGVSPALGTIEGETIYFQNLCAVIEVPYYVPAHPFNSDGNLCLGMYNVEMGLSGVATCNIYDLSISYQLEESQRYVSVPSVPSIGVGQSLSCYYCVFPFEGPFTVCFHGGTVVPIKDTDVDPSVVKVAVAKSHKYVRNHIYKMKTCNINYNIP